MEKVIREWRVIETDDGYRLEIKGDKQAIRHWVEHFQPCGPKHRVHHWPRFGPRHARFWGHGFECCEQDTECDEAEEQTEA
jgi:hypothetical protein